MYLPRTFDGAAHRELTLSLMRTHPLATVVAQIDTRSGAARARAISRSPR